MNILIHSTHALIFHLCTHSWEKITREDNSLFNMRRPCQEVSFGIEFHWGSRSREQNTLRLTNELRIATNCLRHRIFFLIKQNQLFERIKLKDSGEYQVNFFLTTRIIKKYLNVKKGHDVDSAISVIRDDRPRYANNW